MFRGTLAAILLLLPLSVAQAHHGWAGYDLTKEFTVTAVIQKLSYDWPHVTIWIDPSDGSPKKTWTATLAPPSRMDTRGVPATDIAIGKTVKLTGYPNRNDPNEFRAERMWIGNRQVELR